MLNSAGAEQIIVLGLGNILYGDEGFGVRAAERLHTRHVFPPTVEIVDAGTLGHMLLPFVERADRLLILDAVDFALTPGTLVVRDDEGIPAWLGGTGKISPHQNSFSEILALADLKDCLPRQIRLIGLQPFSLDYGTSLSETALARLDEAERLALCQLTLWGVPPLDGNAPPDRNETRGGFQSPALALECFMAPRSPYSNAGRHSG